MLTSPQSQTTKKLLSGSDPAPVEWVNKGSTARVALLCEHAGQAVPEKLEDLGVTHDILNSHRGWDLGTNALARAVAKRLDAPLILQRYSRLVIDCNRPPSHADSMPSISDSVPIPANTGLNAEQAAKRVTEIFQPLDDALNDMFYAAPRTAAFSIHSFTPAMNGQDRPWHAGLLCRADMKTAHTLQDAITVRAPDKTVAINEPYQIDDASDWFIPVHAEARNLRHTLIEIRNDELATPNGIAFWADTLAAAITHVLDQK